MVEIGKHPGRAVGAGIGRGDGAAEANPVGYRCQRRQERQRFGPCDQPVLDGVGEVLAVIVVNRKFVGDEDHVQLGGLSRCATVR